MGDLGSLSIIGMTALGGSLLLASDPVSIPVTVSGETGAISSDAVPAPGKVLSPTERKAGRIYLTAVLASAHARLIIDTGASHTILSTQDARRAKAVRIGAASVATAGGVASMEVARVSAVSIGDQTVRDVDVLVSDDVAESLLGLDLLDRIGATHVSLAPGDAIR